MNPGIFPLWRNVDAVILQNERSSSQDNTSFYKSQWRGHQDASWGSWPHVAVMFDTIVAAALLFHLWHYGSWHHCYHWNDADGWFSLSASLQVGILMSHLVVRLCRCNGTNLPLEKETWYQLGVSEIGPSLIPSRDCCQHMPCNFRSLRPPEQQSHPATWPPFEFYRRVCRG